MAAKQKDPTPAEEAPAEEQPNAVLIVRSRDEDGNVGTNVAILGDVQPTEVQTIIELGLAGWRQGLGLSG
jgi:hypothetical protein